MVFYFLTPDPDRRAVIWHSHLKGSQAAALLTPVIFAGFSLVKRKPLALVRFLKWNTYGTVVIGPLIGQGLAYGRLYNVDQEGVQDRAERIQYNLSQVHTDDWATKGFMIGALAGTFLPKSIEARIFEIVLGSGGIGSAAGVLAHLAAWRREMSRTEKEHREMAASQPT